MKLQRAHYLLLLFVFSCFSTVDASAREYPTRPVRWIIGYPPGGASDLLVRVVAQQLSDAWSQQVVVDNRPGAAGIIAAEMAAKAPADGYTLFLGDISTHSINQSLYRKLPYDPVKDFAPVSTLGVVPNIVVVSPAFALQSISDLIKVAKAKPASLNYASGGNGTGTHLATELFKSLTSVQMTHVPYKGTPPALIDLAAGAVQVMFAGAPPALPFIKGGRLRAIAVTSSERFALLPGVPTVAETLPKYEATTWYGVLLPRRAPAAIIQELNTAVRQALEVAEVKRRLSEQGFTVQGSTPKEFAAFMTQEAQKYATVIRTAGIRVD